MTGGDRPNPSFTLHFTAVFGKHIQKGDTQLLPTGWIIKIGRKISLRAKVIKKMSENLDCL